MSDPAINSYLLCYVLADGPITTFRNVTWAIPQNNGTDIILDDDTVHFKIATTGLYTAEADLVLVQSFDADGTVIVGIDTVGDPEPSFINQGNGQAQIPVRPTAGNGIVEIPFAIQPALLTAGTTLRVVVSAEMADGTVSTGRGASTFGIVRVA